jgi:cyclopropane fatty-acyl-phospholipid synthase-like methyltransferase
MSSMWDERFSGEDYYYGVSPNLFLKSVVGIFPEKAKILSIGEGEGRNATFLASLGHQVTAVDSSSEGMRKAQLLAKKSHVSFEYQLSYLEDYEFGCEKWDAIVSIFCHLPPTIRRSLHQKLQMSLKEKGIFISQSYSPEQLNYQTGGPKDISMLYTEELIKTDFSDLNWLRLQKVTTQILEGQGHTGMSSVINAIGLKVNQR